MNTWKRSILASFALFLAPAAMAQQPTTIQRADVLTKDAAATDVGDARLIRLPSGVAASLAVNDGALMEGDVYTMWIVVFNEPDQCPSGDCGSDPVDFQDPDLVGLDIGFAEGTIVRQDGELRVAAWIPAGMLEGFPDQLGMTSGQGLDRIRQAHVLLVLRDHGPLQPDVAIDQLTTYMGGCDYASSPLDPDTAGTGGGYACTDRYYASFEAP